MQRFFDFIDDVACSADEPGAAKWLDRIAFVFVILMVLASPHSIAVSQGAWLIGLIVSVIRLGLKPRRKPGAVALHLALMAFFGWSLVSGLFSYDQATSLDRLRSVGLLSVFFVTAWNIRKVRSGWFLAVSLVFSCTVVALLAPILRIVGRGVEIHGVNPDGPLGRSGFTDGDTLLLVNGKKISDPAPLIAALETNEVVTVVLHRPDAYLTHEVKRSMLLPGTTPGEKLGFADWGTSHYWRSAGFFSHFTTFSESLQLIGSLALGLVLALFRSRRSRDAAAGEIAADDKPSSIFARLGGIISSTWFLTFCFGAICLALVLTSTRASQLSLLVSGFAMIAVSRSRKFLITSILIALPFVVAGLVLLERSRQVGFVDTSDDSTQYRLTMWRDGMRLWTTSPRNFVFGIGMDSAKSHWQEWGMYDGGRMIISHFHSTPIQILVERGLPALLIWLMVLGIYARTLWRGLKANGDRDWRATGIMLGCLGGTIGFITSGFVHYNIGDGEVAMIFYLMMGLGVRTAELCSGESRIESLVTAET